LWSGLAYLVSRRPRERCANEGKEEDLRGARRARLNSGKSFLFICGREKSALHSLVGGGKGPDGGAGGMWEGALVAATSVLRQQRRGNFNLVFILNISGRAKLMEKNGETN